MFSLAPLFGRESWRPDRSKYGRVQSSLSFSFCFFYLSLSTERHFFVKTHTHTHTHNTTKGNKRVQASSGGTSFKVTAMPCVSCERKASGTHVRHVDAWSSSPDGPHKSFAQLCSAFTALPSLLLSLCLSLSLPIPRTSNSRRGGEQVTTDEDHAKDGRPWGFESSTTQLVY